MRHRSIMMYTIGCGVAESGSSIGTFIQTEACETSLDFPRHSCMPKTPPLYLEACIRGNFEEVHGFLARTGRPV